MGNEVYSAAVAIGLGAIIGTGLFIPFVAVSYRRRGRLTLGRATLWAAALVYFFAIWTYTLLPLPDPDAMRCTGVNLRLLASVDDIMAASGWTDPAVLQVLLNVLLFMPLGFFLRVLGGRGVLTALGVGLGISLFVETTQLTGVWGVYPCAYRLFDVDDLVTNTLGAVLGSVIAAVIVPRRVWQATVENAAAPHPVTRARRVLAVVCDALGVWLLGATASVVVQIWLQYVVGDRAAVLDGSAAAVAGTVVPLVSWFAVVMTTGRTVGDLAVELRYVGGPHPEPVARMLRFVGGVGGWMLLTLLPSPWNVAAYPFALTSVVLLFTTERGRGLPGIIADRRLVDARERSEPPSR
ncbi:MAG: VanZ family protein [Microbacterium sp.]|nr:MAG: VanZ family protein [Microbacterium sp.]